MSWIGRMVHWMLEDDYLLFAVQKIYKSPSLNSKPTRGTGIRTSFEYISNTA